jgi:hypothetical protein
MIWWRFDLTGQMGRRGLQRSATVQRLNRMATADAAIKTYLAPVIQIFDP